MYYPVYNLYARKIEEIRKAGVSSIKSSMARRTEAPCRTPTPSTACCLTFFHLYRATGRSESVRYSDREERGGWTTSCRYARYESIVVASAAMESESAGEAP
jgi:hypothetical protein